MSQPEEIDENLPQWGRDTEWRQGSILSPGDVVALGLGSDEGGAVVVVSHDCDIAQSDAVEPHVEVIVGRFIDGLNGNFTHGKNARTLHLECSGGEDHRSIELSSTKKRTLSKGRDEPSLLGRTPLQGVSLTSHQRRILRSWLSARYARSAFPDEFDRRLEDTGVKERLGRALKTHGSRIAAIFFDVDNGEEVVHEGADDPFELVITLMYSTDGDPAEALKQAVELKKRIEEIFASRCTKVEGGVTFPQWVDLGLVEVIADEAMTVADAQRLSKWNADHVSHRAGPGDPIMELE